MWVDIPNMDTDPVFAQDTHYARKLGPIVLVLASTAWDVVAIHSRGKMADLFQGLVEALNKSMLPLLSTWSSMMP